MPVPCPHCKTEINDLTGWIPKDRFDAEIRKRDELGSQLAAATSELGQLKPKAERAAQLEQELTQTRTRAETYQTLAGSGFADPSVARVIEFEWGQLPAENRPTLAEFIQRGRGDPATVPLGIRHHFAPGGGAQAATQQTPQGAAAPGAASTQAAAAGAATGAATAAHRDPVVPGAGVGASTQRTAADWAAMSDSDIKAWAEAAQAKMPMGPR